MQVYFLSSLPAALYVGGAYLGRVSKFERFARLSLQDRLPIRFEAEGMFPLTFFADERLPISPPAGVDIYRLENALAIYAHGFTPSQTSLRVIAQKRQGDILATISQQGGITLSVDCPSGFFTAPLPPTFLNCELFFWGDFIVIKQAEELLIFNEKAEKLLEENVLKADFSSEEISLIIRLSDLYNRTAECKYRLQNGNLQRTAYQIRQGAQRGQDGLLAYAFFEAVRIQADVTPFLCDDLCEKSDSVYDFLGDFLHVLPTEDPTECLLVYQKAERLFDVRRFKVIIDGDKITDVSG